MLHTQTDVLQIVSLVEGEALPMDLLLMADPNPEFLRSYLPCCIVLVAKWNNQPVGVVTMCPENREKAEIRNLAVHPDYRRQGIARQLLNEASVRAARLGYKSLQVCTGNSSIRPFQLYQQFGFALTDVRWNYFADHYPQLLVEEGIPCLHQLVLTKHI